MISMIYAIAILLLKANHAVVMAAETQCGLKAKEQASCRDTDTHALLQAHMKVARDMLGSTLTVVEKVDSKQKGNGNDCSKQIVMPCDCEATTFNHLICDKRVGNDKSQCSVSAFGCTFAELCPSYCDSSLEPSPTTAPPAPPPAPPSGDPDSWGMMCDTTNDCCSSTLCPGFSPPAGDTVTGYRPNCQCSNGCSWGKDCGRDAPVAANNYFQPKRHCGAGGHCESGSWTDSQDTTSPRYCLIYNNGKFVREKTPAGYCMGVYEKAYADFLVTVRPENTKDFIDTLQWMMDPSHEVEVDQRMSCTDDSFCLGYGAATGEIGSCQCSSTGSTSIDVIDLDRFEAILDSECTDSKYCSGHGTATFSSGSCSCTCDGGHTGSNCELADGEACTDFEDCFGHGYASGTRPNCQCDCNVAKLASTHQFTGDKCDHWTWGSSSGEYVHQLTLQDISPPLASTTIASTITSITATTSTTPPSPPPPPPAPTGTCKQWCAQSPSTWTKKCTWANCEGCTDCR